jgi:hypothetical protein
MISKTLTVAGLREAVDAGDIDTVVLAMVDMQGDCRQALRRGVLRL